MSELNAAVGLGQLARLDEYIAWREGIAKNYTEHLKGVPRVTLVLPKGRSSWYKYIVLPPLGVNKDKLKQSMKEQGVSLSGEVYDIPLHRQPIFKDLADGEFPVADDICPRHICLPLYYGMTEEEARFVIDTLKRNL
jgi:dTDP-4-amino-4,6-dideoxygalactose transaminase